MALPSLIRRQAIFRHVERKDRSATASLLLAAAAIGFDEHANGKLAAPSWTAMDCDTLAYGEAVIEGRDHMEVVRVGWGLIREWLEIEGKAQADRAAVQEALTPTEDPAAPTTSGADGSASPTSEG